jgi:hypothetical protein
VGYDTFIAYEKRLRDSVEVVAYSSEQEYKLFVVSSKVKSIQVEKSPSLTIAVKKIEGSWSEPTPCTARVCGKGTQRQTCSTPSGGGSWCPLTWGARIIEGAPGGVRVQEKDCEAPAPCLERTRDVGCLNEEQFNSIQKCQNQTSADACKEKNESYVCNFSTSGWCFFAGNKITVTAVRCEAPSAGDMPQIYDVVYKETSNQIEVHTIRTDQLKVIQVDGATLSAPKETRLGEQYEYKTYWLFDLKDISKKEVAVKFEATRTHGVSSPLTITQESKIYPYMGAPKIVDDFRKGSFGGLCNVGDFNTEMRISTYHASRVTWKGDKGFNAEMRLVRVDEFGKQEWSSSAVRRKRCSYLPDDVANEVFKIVAENSYGVAEKQVGGQKDLTCGEGYCTTLD